MYACKTSKPQGLEEHLSLEEHLRLVCLKTDRLTWFKFKHASAQTLHWHRCPEAGCPSAASGAYSSDSGSHLCTLAPVCQQNAMCLGDPFVAAGFRHLSVCLRMRFASSVPCQVLRPDMYMPIDIVYIYI